MSLLDHLQSGIFVAEEYAPSIDAHGTVPIVRGHLDIAFDNEVKFNATGYLLSGSGMYFAMPAFATICDRL